MNRPLGRRPRTGIALVVLFVVAFFGDQVVQNLEMKHLLDNVQASEASMVEYKTTATTAQTPLGNACGNSNASYVSPACQDAARQWLAEVPTDAARSEAAIRVAGDAVDQTQILPWHHALRAAREAYVAHNTAWVQWLKSLTKDPKKALDRSGFADIDATFRIAHRRFDDAMPWLTFGDSGKRIKAIWIDDRS
jgi:hypothetical protein